MSQGLQIINSLGTIQIDQGYKNTHVSEITTSNGGTGEQFASLAFAYSNEIPAIFAQSQSVGPPVNSYPSYPRGSQLHRPMVFSDANGWHLWMYEGSPFKAAMCTNDISPIETGDSFGLRVWRGDGVELYSSRRMYPRVTHVFTKPAGVPLPVTFNISGYSSNPWVYLNALPVATYSTGEDWAMEAAAVWFNSDFSQVTVGYTGDYNFWWADMTALRFSFALAKIGDM